VRPPAEEPEREPEPARAAERGPEQAREAERAPREPEPARAPERGPEQARGPAPEGGSSTPPEPAAAAAEPARAVAPDSVAGPAVPEPAPAAAPSSAHATTANAASRPAAASGKSAAPRPDRLAALLDERPEVPIELPSDVVRTRSRRDFMLFTLGVLASALGAWWLLPNRTRARIAGGSIDKLDSLAARLGLTRDRAEGVLDRALTFDDDVAEALYSKDRRVRTYDRSQVTPLRNNYDGQTPGPGYLPLWRLHVSGLASGREESLSIGELLERFTLHEQVTRLVCVEGWSAVAWWGGIRFADFLAALPPAPGARWAALRSSVNLDGAGRPDPFYVSIDLETARHEQTLLATHLGGRPLHLEHGAPLRLLVPMKLGLKNIKAITDIAYTVDQPADYWNERGYSKYDGL
jgi:DMSO/TMAO reductase YedYZ molybdopterin-dependent catalytic subunit